MYSANDMLGASSLRKLAMYRGQNINFRVLVVGQLDRGESFQSLHDGSCGYAGKTKQPCNVDDKKNDAFDEITYNEDISSLCIPNGAFHNFCVNAVLGDNVNCGSVSTTHAPVTCDD